MDMREACHKFKFSSRLVLYFFYYVTERLTQRREINLNCHLSDWHNHVQKADMSSHYMLRRKEN